MKREEVFKMLFVLAFCVEHLQVASAVILLPALCSFCHIMIIQFQMFRWKGILHQHLLNETSEEWRGTKKGEICKMIFIPRLEKKTLVDQRLYVWEKRIYSKEKFSASNGEFILFNFQENLIRTKFTPLEHRIDFIKILHKIFTVGSKWKF